MQRRTVPVVRGPAQHIGIQQFDEVGIAQAPEAGEEFGRFHETVGHVTDAAPFKGDASRPCRVPAAVGLATVACH